MSSVYVIKFDHLNYNKRHLVSNICCFRLIYCILLTDINSCMFMIKFDAFEFSVHQLLMYTVYEFATVICIDSYYCFNMIRGNVHYLLAFILFHVEMLHLFICFLLLIFVFNHIIDVNFADLIKSEYCSL